VLELALGSTVAIINEPLALDDVAPKTPVSTATRHPILGFIVRRVATGVLTLWIVSILIFAATNILPGNVAEVVLGRNATPGRVHALDVRLGLNHPMVQRYFEWLFGILHGNFGQSAVSAALNQVDTSVSSTLVSPLLNSLILAGITALLLIPLTLGLGALAGIYARRALDHAISVPALVLGGLPEFVTGTLFIYIFFVVFHLLPPVTDLAPGQSPFTDPKGLVLPVLTLLGVALGAGVRQVRAGMYEALQRDYVQFARLNGIPEKRVLLRYALRNALAPSVQIIAQNLQYLLGGIIVVESVFAYPGIGLYLVNAVLARDTVKVEAAAIIIAAAYTLLNILADLIVVLLVPKLRTSQS
jgi:peptide/nickel transport system permease protein